MLVRRLPVRTYAHIHLCMALECLAHNAEVFVQAALNNPPRSVDGASRSHVLSSGAVVQQDLRT